MNARLKPATIGRGRLVEVQTMNNAMQHARVAIVRAADRATVYERVLQTLYADLTNPKTDERIRTGPFVALIEQTFRDLNRSLKPE